MQPQRFVMLSISADSYNVLVKVTGHFSRPSHGWWFKRKQHSSIPYTFDSLVTQICKTCLLPNIRDDAITALIQLLT
jgi:hypothetical protein